MHGCFWPLYLWFSSFSDCASRQEKERLLRNGEEGISVMHHHRKYCQAIWGCTDHALLRATSGLSDTRWRSKCFRIMERDYNGADEQKKVFFKSFACRGKSNIRQCFYCGKSMPLWRQKNQLVILTGTDIKLIWVQ